MVRALAFVVGLMASSSFAQWPDLFKPLPKQYSGEKDAALIISISDYAFLPDVPGANENAKAWFQHLTVTRGIPTTQVQWIQDNEATVVGIRKAMKQLAADTKPGGVAWVLYIGHGAPAQDGNDGVLVGVGAQNTVEELYANSVPQKELLKALDSGRQARAVVLIDACFSGDASGTGKQLATSTMPTLPERVAPPEAKKPVLVLSAGTSRQFAGALPGANVPAFSYLALGAMRGWADEDNNGQVTAGEAIRYINAVMRTTVKGRTQTPQLNPETSEELVIGRAGKNEPAPALNEIVLGLKTGTGGRIGEAKEEVLEPAPEVKVGGPKVSKGSVKAVVGSLTIKTVPTGVRLDLVDPKGATLATKSPFIKADATSGVWRVKATAEGYAPEQTEVDVPADEVAFSELTLKQYAGLEVTGTPAGASVKVVGLGFSDEGGLPWSAEGLVAGEYTVSITREGYEPQEWNGVLQPGKTQRVTTKLVRLMSQSKFMEAAEAGKDLYATITTTQGEVVVRFFAKDAPKTVANFVGLASGEKEFTDLKTGKPAKRAFYDGLFFHRVIPNFMIQGGDPEGSGRGGPGYTFEDEFQSGRAFDKVGLLAMANKGPGTNGSQFFITTSTPTYLNGKHTIFGEVISGYENVVNLADAARGPMDRPTSDQKILKVVISEKAPVLEKAREGRGAGGCPAGMVFVKGGTYTMGDLKDRVTVADFCLDVTEVTVAAYTTRATGPTTTDWEGATAKEKADASKYCNGNRRDKTSHPMNCVDWNAATSYCEASGHRLPTEEEWEWAARGGDRGSTYPWGDSAPGSQVCWDGEGSDLGKGNRLSTCAVGSFPSGDSPLGIKDLAGNVWEWTEGRVDTSPRRVRRGGGWYVNHADGLRAAYRTRASPSLRDWYQGFRCARTPE